MDKTISAETALERLRKGNAEYVDKGLYTSNVSHKVRRDLKENGQHPFACIITCSDSRVIPESVFSVGLGDLFVIRVAGNVIGEFVLGSVEYAAEHLKTPLVVVLGHTECGAVAAAMDEADDTHIGSIVTEIQEAIGNEHDRNHASLLNVEHSVDKLKKNLTVSGETKAGLRILGGMYDIDTGRVEFYEEPEA